MLAIACLRAAASLLAYRPRVPQLHMMATNLGLTQSTSALGQQSSPKKSTGGERERRRSTTAVLFASLVFENEGEGANSIFPTPLEDADEPPLRLARSHSYSGLRRGTTAVIRESLQMTVMSNERRGTTTRLSSFSLRGGNIIAPDLERKAGEHRGSTRRLSVSRLTMIRAEETTTGDLEAIEAVQPVFSYS